MGLKLSAKMTVAAIVNVGIMLALAGWSYHSSTQFRDLQDAGAASAASATQVSIAAASGGGTLSHHRRCRNQSRSDGNG